jgi:hypothetical protein
MTKAPSGESDRHWPPGLQDLTLTLRFPAEAVNFDRLFREVSETPGFSRRSDGGGIRGALRGERGWGPIHAHFDLNRNDRGDIVLELEILTSSHGRFKTGVPTLSRFITTLRAYIANPDASFRGLVGAHFSLSTEEWTPTVPLPFTPPEPLDKIPGLPQISGVDFSFSEQTPEQPLIRAFVTTYDAINRFVIRILTGQPVEIDIHLVDLMRKTATDYLPYFAVEKKGEK